MLSLERSGQVVGGLRWCELTLWRAMSTWAVDAGDPVAAVLWDAHAGHAAWRAGQWWERLPVLADVERDALVVAPSPGWAAVAGALGGLTTTVGRMVGAYRVALPRLADAYAAVGPSTSALSDAPVTRTLAQAEADAGADWRAGTYCLHRLLTGPDAVAEAASVCSALERLAAGGPAGEAAQ